MLSATFVSASKQFNCKQMWNIESTAMRQKNYNEGKEIFHSWVGLLERRMLDNHHCDMFFSQRSVSFILFSSVSKSEKISFWRWFPARLTMSNESNHVEYLLSPAEGDASAPQPHPQPMILLTAKWCKRKKNRKHFHVF